MHDVNSTGFKNDMTNYLGPIQCKSTNIFMNIGHFKLPFEKMLIIDDHEMKN
jgi:hypothetical protein